MCLSMTLGSCDRIPKKVFSYRTTGQCHCSARLSIVPIWRQGPLSNYTVSTLMKSLLAVFLTRCVFGETVDDGNNNWNLLFHFWTIADPQTILWRKWFNKLISHWITNHKKSFLSNISLEPSSVICFFYKWYFINWQLSMELIKVRECIMISILPTKGTPFRSKIE